VLGIIEYHTYNLEIIVRIAIIFPKDSEAIFNTNSNRTFGGATTQLYMLAKEMVKNKDLEVFSFIPNYREICFLDEDKFNLVKAYNENDNIIKKIFSLYYIIKKTSPDVIIQRGLTLQSCILALYCNLSKIKFVFMFGHDLDSHGIYQTSRKRCYLFPMLLRNSYRIITQNEYEYNQIAQSHKHVKSKSHILKKGLDTSYIKFGLKKVYDCMWAAKCEEWKKPEFFLKLASHNRDLKFLMICTIAPSSKKFYDKIKSEAEKLENLTFLDFVEYEKIFEYFAQSKVFCTTSEMEGDWPMTVLESAASGLPILSLHLNYEGIFDETDGGFYCNGDFELMSKYLKILIKDKKIYEKKSLGAKEFVKNSHSIEKNTELFIKYINK
jgi:glycosyltransferase involved in cell wall biosynthesis